MGPATSLHIPATAALLDAWEYAQTTVDGGRSLRLLEVMCDDTYDRLDTYSPGQLNRLLVSARALLFGDICDTVADCPGCAEQLEASIPMSGLLSGDDTASDAGELLIGELRVGYRLPTWRELTALSDRSIEAAADELLGGCVTSIRSGERTLTLSDVDASGERDFTVSANATADQQKARVALRQLIDTAICAADIDALIQVELACPDCGETCSFPMDPGMFLWEEINRWALSTLLEVAELAATYGWSQESILSMSPWRRKAYLSLAASAGTPA